ncbi:fructokinase [Albimonas donghaensis]|uniref:Fructokinase n=1 Tax=Albimonas donghaensis TaxID=356660 RepID=A0A1H3BMN1_9RHOB|nr:carbohydrate kinase [Albimonas donghaensis]SDX42604.1 fructokinase [Albimonas donghaensis]
MTILVCGEALFDVFVDQEHPLGFRLDARIGGSAFNLAIGLARLGRGAGLLTGIGAGVMGRKLRGALEAEGVDARYLVDKPDPVTLAMVEVKAGGSADYVFHGEGAADRAVTGADLPELDGLRALAFGCFSLLTRPTGDSFLSLASRARAAGLPVALDPNIRASVEPDMGVWRTRVDAFAACADIVKVSEEDFEALNPGMSPEEGARRWLGLGASLVALTRGGGGAEAWTETLHVSCEAPQVEVADTVGAGDSFLAGLLCALDEGGALTGEGVRGLDAARLTAALEFASAVASITCTRRGADIPRRDELPQRF